MIPLSPRAIVCVLAMTAGCASSPFSNGNQRGNHSGGTRLTSAASARDANVAVVPASATSAAHGDRSSVVQASSYDPRGGDWPGTAIRLSDRVAQQEVPRESLAEDAGTSTRSTAGDANLLSSPEDGRTKSESAIEPHVAAAAGASDPRETVPERAAAGPEELASLSAASQPAGTVVLNLDNVLQIAQARNPQIAVARERISEAYARALRAQTAWLPSLRSGINYNHHEGTIQDVAGHVFPTNRSALYGGLGAGAVGAASPAIPGLLAQFHLADAVFQPSITGHQTAARQFSATAVRNDTLRDTAIAYLELVRAEHASLISLEAVENTEKLSDLTAEFAEVGEGLNADFTRVQAELAVRRSDQLVQQEAVQVASARLAQLLHAQAGVLITSGEPTVTPLDILDAEADDANLVADGLLRRPELAEQKHLVCEAVERLRREQYAPLVPSVLLGVSYGAMGGGLGSSITNTGDRWDADAIAYWELRNLGFGEQAARRESASQARQARLRKVALLDQVAREVVEAHARVNARRARIAIAQGGIAAAERSYRLNWERIENAQGLPIEVLQSVQALNTARRAYLDAVIDYNVAQFQLCHATGVLVQ